MKPSRTRVLFFRVTDAEFEALQAMADDLIPRTKRYGRYSAASAAYAAVQLVIEWHCQREARARLEHDARLEPRRPFTVDVRPGNIASKRDRDR